MILVAHGFSGSSLYIVVLFNGSTIILTLSPNQDLNTLFTMFGKRQKWILYPSFNTIVRPLFPGHGILGCNATQMHEKIVARLLQIMFYMVRQCMRSVQGFVPNERLLMGGVGLPSLEAP